MPWYRKDAGRGTEYKSFKGEEPPAACRATALPNDSDADGHECGRLSVAVCDAREGLGACDMPVCIHHDTAGLNGLHHCPRHAHLAEQRRHA